MFSGSRSRLYIKNLVAQVDDLTERVNMLKRHNRLLEKDNQLFRSELSNAHSALRRKNRLIKNLRLKMRILEGHDKK